MTDTVVKTGTYLYAGQVACDVRIVHSPTRYGSDRLARARNVAGPKMILRQREGPEIELRILGYEFSQGVTDWHDLNWLNILVRVNTVGASWTGGPDACLLTTEARELAAWLRTAADGHPVRPLEFLEPELSFAVAREPDERGIPVAVTLRHAFVSNQPLVSGRPSELPFVLYVAPEVLLSAASELEADLLRYPVREPAS